jgi:succinate dehydrogenase / fumarate reductase membrane anchor subunit
MTLRSPLGRVLGLGSAQEGAAHWWSQRITSVALALLTSWFLVSILMLGSFEYDAIVPWMATPVHATLLALMVATIAYHSYLGVQVVIEDYVPQKGRKIILMLLANFFHVVVAALGIFAVLRIAFGAAA